MSSRRSSRHHSHEGGDHSDLYRAIWTTVRSIPRGRVATYGQIARISGIPGHARLVGYALHNLPHLSDVPWHRVINARGMISLPKTQGAYADQKRLLAKEGVVFKNDRVDLARFGIW